MSDGCTYFNWAEAIWPVRPCCEHHDAGGSLWELFTCLIGATPYWAWGPIVLIVAAVPFVMRLRRR